LPREPESYKVSPDVQMKAKLSEHFREGSNFTHAIQHASQCSSHSPGHLPGAAVISHK